MNARRRPTVRFDAPPMLTGHQRAILLDLPGWAETYLQQIQTPTNKLGFVLQLGYFRQGRLCGGNQVLHGGSVRNRTRRLGKQSLAN